MKHYLSNAIFWLALGGVALLALAFVNQHKPVKPKLLAPLPSRSLITCFVAGEVVFSGDVLGEVETDSTRKISFFSLDLNTKLEIFNGACVVLKKKP